MLKKQTKNSTTKGLKSLAVKGVAGALAFSLIFGLTACGPKKTDTTSPSGNGSTPSGTGTGNKSVSSETPYFEYSELESFDLKEGYVLENVSLVSTKDKILALGVASTMGGGMVANGEMMVGGDGSGSSEDTIGSAAETSDSTLASAAGNSSSLNVSHVASKTESTEAKASTEAEATGEASETEANPSQAESSFQEIMPISQEMGGGESISYLGIFDLSGKKLDQIDLTEKYGGEITYHKIVKSATDKIFLFGRVLDSKNNSSKANTASVSYTMTPIDDTGNAKEESISLILENENWNNVDTIFIDSQDRIILKGYQGLAAFDAKGKILVDISESSWQFASDPMEFDGKVIVTGYDTSSQTFELKGKTIDFEAGKLVDASPLPSNLQTDGFSSKVYFIGQDAYVVNSTGISKVDIKADTKETFFKWSDTSFLRNNLSESQVDIIDESTILYKETPYGGTDTKLVIFKKSAANPHAGKTILTLGGISLGYDTKLKKQVYDFNQNNKEYFVELKDYMDSIQTNSEKEYIASFIQVQKTMNLDILSGKGPDILWMDSSTLDFYANKGLLVDLNGFFEKDPDLKKEDFLENLVKMGEVDGKLYQMIQSFYLYGWVGATSRIGDRNGWTVEEFEEVANKLEEGSQMLYQAEQSELFFQLFVMNSKLFIDMNTNKVDLNNGEFAKLLDFAKTYGTPAEAMQNQDTMVDGMTQVDTKELLRNGELILFNNVYISSPSGYQDMAHTFQEPISLVGLPSASKSGPQVMTNANFAITNSSKNKEAVWEFLRQGLLPAAQDPAEESIQMYGMEGIPVLKTSFEKSIENAMKQKVDGNSGGMISYNGGMSIEVGTGALTEENATAFRKVIEGLNSPTYSGDMDSFAMVKEEVAAYFAGTKTADQVAKILQDKLQTLINEKQ